MALGQIADDPCAQHANVERLVGFKDGFRLRHGDMRAIYRVDREAKVVFVEDIARRDEVYKR